MELFVPQEVNNVFETHGMSVVSIEENDHEVYFELEAYTNANGDMLHMLCLDKDGVDDVRAWWKEFNEMYENFDPYDHAAGWMNHLDETPFSCNAELFKDAIDYDNELKAIEQELFNLIFKPEPRKFYVDLTMNATIQLCIQADSIEDASNKASRATYNKRFFDSIKDDFDFDEWELFDTMRVTDTNECFDNVDPIDIDSFIV